MYLAELHGKLSRNIERMEDILTSNVFSFFKYARRDIFLKPYLENVLGIPFTAEDLRETDFVFWPSYDDGTQPDLVMITGSYYLLFEAKYFSDFGKETAKRKDQVTREIEGGSLEAKRLGKRFVFVAVTADSVFRKDKFSHLNSDLPARFCWTNWQAVASLLESIIARKPHGLAHHERCHAQDLLDLLDRKNLRSFGGFNLEGHFTPRDRIFFEVESASFRGSFIGFEDAMSGCTMIDPVLDIIFFKNGTARPQRSFFEALGKTNLNAVEYDRIFFQRRST
ncbi:MAG: hypothetical protein V2J65_05030 [Desulfobacteraceae bacterium]|nr:hypothetical protein [Desulfobacteraceae bacterium]